MSKEKEMREIVEHDLAFVIMFLDNAERHNLTESKIIYTAQKLALESILRRFDELEA